jgi:5-methylcytosine-specific restriction endonuclease McrA
MHISPIHVSLQTLLIAFLVLFVLIILVRLSRRGRLRRAPTHRTRRARPLFPGRTIRSSSGRRDHGAEVASKYGKARSPEWPRVAHEHLLHEPACVVCGHRGKGLQVHHIKPFHLYPELELDPHNLITLCEVKGRDHHLLVGHLDDWESYNLNVRDDTRRYHDENAKQIRANPAWQKEEAHRPHP